MSLSKLIPLRRGTQAAAFLAAAFALLNLAPPDACAAPTLAVGSASGQAGNTVSFPIDFISFNASVASLSFEMTLPASISTVSVTAGGIVTNAQKMLSTNKTGNVWKFIVFGLNQDILESGTLLMAQVRIAAGTAAGTLNLTVANAVYSDPDGVAIPAGTNTGGTIIVTAAVPPAPVITSGASASGVVGTPFSYQIIATNSPTSFNATGRPAGISVNTTTGLLSGTPTAAGTSNVTLTATNAGGSDTQALTITVTAAVPPAPVITSGASASGTVGTAFSYQIIATNSPTSFNATGLPAGVSVNTTTGLLSGTPTAAGTSNVTLTATNAGGSDTQALTITVSAPTTTAPTLSVGSVSGQSGNAVTFPVSFNPGSASVAGIQFEITLPASISTVTATAGSILTTAQKSLSTNKTGSTWRFVVFGLNQTSIGAGTLLTAQVQIAAGTAAGTLNLSVANTVYSDPDGATITPGTSTGGTITVTAAPLPAPVVTSGASASGVVGTAFTYQITASNTPASFNATGLPAGLSVNTGTGLISGTPTAAGTSNVTLSATNATGTGTKALTLTLSAAVPPAPVITSASAAIGIVGTAFTYQIAATNSPTGFNATGLPAGVSVNTTTGLLSGTPTTAGTSNVTLTATNAGGSGTKALTVTISAPVTTQPILIVGSASGQAGGVVNFPVTFSPGSASVAGLQFELTLPASISTVSVTAGSIMTSAQKTLSTTKTGNLWKFIVFGLNQDTLAAGTLLTAQVRIAAGTAAGTLNLAIANTVYTDPGGLAITPGASTGGTVTVTATAPVAPVVTSGASASGAVGTAFTYQITASNTPTSFNATGLPAGLSVNTGTGLISGTPTAAGTSNVTLSATNAAGTGTKALAITVSATAPAAPVVTSAATATGRVGSLFNYQITATNGPTSFNASGLPAGVSVNTATGLLSGTPTTAGTANVTLTATNAGGSGTKALTITISPPTVVSAPTLSVGSVSGDAGRLVNFAIDFNPGGRSVASLQFNITLPPGISTASVTAGPLMTSANKSVSTTKTGNTWTFIIFGLNQTALGTGTLLTAQVQLSATLANGAYPLLISNTVFSDGNGVTIPPGNSTGGLIIVGSSPTDPGALTAPILNLHDGDFIPVNSQISATNTSSLSSPRYSWTLTPTSGGSLSTKFQAARAGTALPAASFTTSSPQANLATISLGLGQYIISVKIIDVAGNSSPAASATVTLVSVDLSGTRAYPNPWRSDRHSVPQITFDHLTTGTTIKIFDTSGHWVKTLPKANDSVLWDLTNDSGDKVASGIYIYMITTDQGQKKTGKVAIIK